MNTRQQKELAHEAFLASVENGGDSSPSDRDYLEIRDSVELAFEGWWRRRLARRSSSRRPGGRRG